jgi:hypothetical protein
MSSDGDQPAFIPVIASVLAHLTQRNSDITVTSEKLKVFHSVKAPPIGISDYLHRIVKYAYCSPECFIFALIYLDRLITQNKNCHITLYNVHRLLITSVLLAAKARDDTYYSNAYYSAIGGISNAEINKLEINFLLLVDFNLFITPETYDQYKTYLMQHSSASKEGKSNELAAVKKSHIPTYVSVKSENRENQSDTVYEQDYCLPGVCPVPT